MKKPQLSKKKIKSKFRPWYHIINKQLYGALDVVRLAWRNFENERAMEASASMAYFSLFSLFPLLIVIISIASFVLKSQFVQDQVLDFIVRLLPITPDLILSNIQNVLDKRGTVGIIATMGLTWSATSMFNILALNIDRAWPENKSHSFFERRIMGFAILMGIAVLLIIFWFFRTMLEVDLIERLLRLFQIPIFETTIWGIVVMVGPLLFRFLMYWIMYQWLPKAYVRPREAFWGAVWASFFTELLTNIMNWYLSSQWVRYELIYGSLGSIIALLLWIYLTSYMVFFGAHICSAVAKLYRPNQDIDQEQSSEPVEPLESPV